METMKRSKRRLAISLLTIIAMVFTLIPCMGTQVAEANTNDLVQTYTPTESCPVSKVEFVKKDDGQYNLKVTCDFSVFAKYRDGEDWFFDLSITDKATDNYLGGKHTSIGSKPSELGGVTDTYECSEKNILTWNQEVAIKFEFIDENNAVVNNPKELVCKAPTPFVGFSAKYYEGESDEYVDVKFTDYYKSDSGYNIFLREDTAAGTIKQLGSETTYKTTRDSDLKPGRTYVYYVVKNSVLQKSMPEFWQSVNSSEKSFSAADKAKLRGISTFEEVAVPGPRIINVSNLQVTPDVRAASLTWDYEYETIEPNVTGFYVRIYSSNGNLYKEYNVTTQNGIKCSAKYAIPYTGTYYFTVTPYYVYEGETYEGTPTAKVACKSKSLSAASGSVTKISNTKARITIKKAAGSTGTMVYQYVSGKWKYMGKTTGSAYTVAKNTAGKKKYRLLSYIVENGKTYNGKYSSTYSPKANVKTFSYSNYPSSYPKYNHYWRPTKISYKGSKVVVSGKFINTHIYYLNYVKIKLTVKCQGKVIGTKVINSGRMNSNKIKKVTVKLDKSKKGYDLRAGGIDWYYTVISYR